MGRYVRAGLGVALLGVLPLVSSSPAAAAPVTFSYSGPPVPIPDAADLSGNAPGAPALATVLVSGLPEFIADVNFRFDGTACSTTAGSTTVGLSHTFVNDLEVKLTSPVGTTVLLINNTDGSGNNFCQVVLDDDAGSPSIQTAVTANAPFTGTWTPNSPLSAFDGQNPNGTWTLSVQDFFSSDTGSLRAFSIIIDAGLPASLPGVVTTSTGWALRNGLASGTSTTFSLGTRPLVPLTGDWNGDGTKTPGFFKGGTFTLYDTIPPATALAPITFGNARGFPVSGDWNGDNKDDLAVYYNGTWELRITGTGGLSSFSFGSGTWPATWPVAGDWDGNGTDGFGLFSGGTWTLRNTPTSPDIVFSFGASLSAAVVGDWDADGDDTVGLKAGTTWTLTNATPPGGPAVVFDYGLANDFPVVWAKP